MTTPCCLSMAARNSSSHIGWRRGENPYMEAPLNLNASAKKLNAYRNYRCRNYSSVRGGILDSFRLRIHSPQTCPNCEAALPFAGNEARVPALIDTHLRLDRPAGDQR